MDYLFPRLSPKFSYSLMEIPWPWVIILPLNRFNIMLMLKWEPISVSAMATPWVPLRLMLIWWPGKQDQQLHYLLSKTFMVLEK
jgi:hypothetical protein